MSHEPVQDGAEAGALAAYEQGLAAFAARNLETAHVAFERAYRKDTRDPRFMSWYGVTLVLVEKNSNLGVVLCEQAVRLAGPEPELIVNQARVHLSLRQRERAVRALLRGLELFPDDERLVAARDAMGIRRPPVISFLSRKNPLNRVLGKLRHRWKQRHVPPYERTPVALGVPFAAVIQARAEAEARLGGGLEPPAEVVQPQGEGRRS